MANYVEIADLEGLLPGQFLTEALDDDGDGTRDDAVWTLIQGQVNTAVDSYFEGRVTVPFSIPIPTLVKRAALLVAGETLYARRGKADSFPFAAELKALRKRLERIASGGEAVPNEIAEAAASSSAGVVIQETAKTTPSQDLQDDASSTKSGVLSV